MEFLSPGVGVHMTSTIWLDGFSGSYGPWIDLNLR